MSAKCFPVSCRNCSSRCRRFCRANCWTKVRFGCCSTPHVRERCIAFTDLFSVIVAVARAVVSTTPTTVDKDLEESKALADRAAALIAKKQEDAQKAEREKAEREKAEREKAEREKADREKAEREKADRERAQREKDQRDREEREKREKEAAAAKAAEVSSNGAV